MLEIKNKKGFTLVEILSVIVLISLLIGISVPGISRISENMKKRNFNEKIKLIEQAGTLWGQDNKTRLQTNICDIDGIDTTGTGTNEYGREYKCHVIKINDLIVDDYLEADKTNEDNSIEYYDAENNDIKDTCVWVYKKNNRVYAKYGKDCNGCISEDCKNNA